VDFNKWYIDLIIMSPNLFNSKTLVSNMSPSLFVCIFDLPARAKALNMINHAGYNACINCNAEGDYDFNKVFYPFIRNLTKRDRTNYNSILNEVLKKEENVPVYKKGDFNIKCIYSHSNKKKI
jgi:hypothetical protein